ncbi:hypothetical protein M3611_26870 [Priestia megaterium]|uniref:hypothetical protein n=1 Tax=Priestia megaterium TaxID=1404 RepID=UPI00203D44C2|nr:hypothetical protein [Priestia megaterium]MCM3155619.1 hypothetical protein [Priestia megaterium]
MEGTKVQFRVSDKDSILHELVTSLQKQEKLTGKRGYANNKIRDMVKAYHLISEHFEESDPYKLMMKIASNHRPVQAATEPIEEEVVEEENVVDSNAYMAAIEGFALK